VWITRAIGIYGEFTRIGLNGAEDGAGEAKTDTMINAVIIGGRFRPGRR